MDPILGYNKHISSVLRLIQHKLSVLGKVKRYMNRSTAMKVYKTMVLPYFDYADVIFQIANGTDLDKLQRLQNRGLKLCLGRERLFSTERAHIEAGVPFLRIEGRPMFSTSCTCARQRGRVYLTHFMRKWFLLFFGLSGMTWAI